MRRQPSHDDLVEDIRNAGIELQAAPFEVGDHQDGTQDARIGRCDYERIRREVTAGGDLKIRIGRVDEPIRGVGQGVPDLGVRACRLVGSDRWGADGRRSNG